jgi:hypothetical protein
MKTDTSPVGAEGKKKEKKRKEILGCLYFA